MSGSDEQRFSMALAVVAQMCQFDLRPEILEIYLQDLKPYGYVLAAKALREMIRDLRPGKSFPSVNEIIGAMGKSSESDDSLAKEAAARIVQGISKWGHCYNPERGLEVKAWLGDLAWEIVQRQGGWNHLCETVTNHSLPQNQAQWRELGKVLCDKARKGTLELPPALPDPKFGGAEKMSTLGSGKPTPAQLVENLTQNMGQKLAKPSQISKIDPWDISR